MTVPRKRGRIRAWWVRKRTRVVVGQHGWIAFYGNDDRSAHTNISPDYAKQMLWERLGVQK